MRVGIYARVSTAKQATEEKTSLGEQVRLCRAWVRDHQGRVVDIYKDAGVSGALLERPELGRAVLDAKDGRFDTLVVLNFDRLARDMLVQETIVQDLDKAGVAVVSITQPSTGDDPSSVLIRQLFGALAQYDRAMVVWRMKLGRDAKKRRGGYADGAPPYGFKSENKNLVPNPDEQEGLALMRRLKREGKTLRQICAELDQRGIPPKRGERWHPMSVKRVLELGNRPRARSGTKIP